MNNQNPPLEVISIDSWIIIGLPTANVNLGRWSQWTSPSSYNSLVNDLIGNQSGSDPMDNLM